MKYQRPGRDPTTIKRRIVSRADDYVDVIQKHLQIRLDDEHKFLMELCRRQVAEDYVRWCEETKERNSWLYSREVQNYFKTAKRDAIDLESDEVKYILGKKLLDSFIASKRKCVVELRKALGLEHMKYRNENIPITSGIEDCELFRLFGSPIYLDDLKVNYKKAARKLHPDVGGSQDAMQALNKAYEFLEKNWNVYSPENLAIDLGKLKTIKGKTFDNAALRSLMDF